MPIPHIPTQHTGYIVCKAQHNKLVFDSNNCAQLRTWSRFDSFEDAFMFAVNQTVCVPDNLHAHIVWLPNKQCTPICMSSQ